MVSASGLLETSHRISNLDYHILMKLTYQLTYLYDENKKGWRLSPAYDLTYSYSLGGQHATTVNGNGENPDFDDILAVAKEEIYFNETSLIEIKPFVEIK